MQALIVTPNPQPTESLLGYTLRVSEANGYPTPTVILQYAGMADSHLRSCDIATEKLAAILNKPPSMLAPLTYRVKQENGTDGFKILNHQFGDTLFKQYIRIAKPAICPDCVSQFGYIDAFWDCSLAVACPVHKSVATEVCHECGNALTWFRGGLLKCKCGGSLCQPNGLPQVSEHVIEFMKLLWARLHDQPTDLLENPCGLPMAALEKMSLRTFINLLDAFARLVTPDRAIESLSKLEVIDKAGRMLINWPHNFHTHLGKIKTNQIKLLGSDISFSSCFKTIYMTLLLPFAVNEVEFIREEYDNYAMNFWDGSKSNAKIKKKESARYISINELAAKVGVRTATIKRLARKGVIKLKNVSTDKQVRWIFDTTQIQMPDFIDPNTMGVRAAASLVGIPVRVLLHLKKTGHYKINNLFLHKDLFSELDLLSFREKLFATCDNQLNDAEQKQPLLSLENVLQRKSFKSKIGKGEFVAAYLDKKLIPAGKTGDSLSKIFFHKQDVIAFQNGCRDNFSKESGVITLRIARELLGTTEYGIHALVEAGLISRSENTEAYILNRQSIELFAKQYIGTTELAYTLKTTSQRLYALCKKSSIESLVFTGKRSVKSQFIKHTDREKLIAVFNSNPRKRNVQSDLGAGMKSCASCEKYLNQLRSQNQNLPMQGNTYDKSKISRICGFSREVIYNNKKVKKLLDDYLAEYYERNNLIILPSDRLRKYIDELKLTYSNPPLKVTGKLNKLSIAKICDFDRHVLYRDPVVIELLNNLENSLLQRA